jgi:endonuclease YncB( thermonuclease family)
MVRSTRCLLSCLVPANETCQIPSTMHATRVLSSNQVSQTDNRTILTTGAKSNHDDNYKSNASNNKSNTDKNNDNNNAIDSIDKNSIANITIDNTSDKDNKIIDNTNDEKSNHSRKHRDSKKKNKNNPNKKKRHTREGSTSDNVTCRVIIETSNKQENNPDISSTSKTQKQDFENWKASFLNLTRKKNKGAKHDTSLEGLMVIAKCVQIIDGDTIRIAFNHPHHMKEYREMQCKVRLAGIDAPPLSTSKGKKAKEYLTHLIESRHDSVLLVYFDKNEKYGRPLVTLYNELTLEEIYQTIQDGKNVYTSEQNCHHVNVQSQVSVGVSSCAVSSINQRMILDGHAYAYHGGKKKTL